MNETLQILLDTPPGFYFGMAIFSAAVLGLMITSREEKE